MEWYKERYTKKDIGVKLYGENYKKSITQIEL